MSETYLHFLTDLAVLLREKAEATKREASGDDYEKGRHFAYYEVLSLIYQQADAFGISPDEIGLSGFDPDRDLL